MRIVSLLPSATEILFAVGAGDSVVGVTHECDYPPQARQRPAVTAGLLPTNLTSAQTAAAGLAATRDRHTIYALNAEALAAAAPDLIVAQRLCVGCEAPVQAAEKVTCTLPEQARVVAANAHTLDDLESVITRIGTATGRVDEARWVSDALQRRLDAVTSAVANRARPRVLVLEWPDPPWIAGRWIPGMVERAGGTCVLSRPGDASERTTFEAVAAAEADLVITAFWRLDLDQSINHIRQVARHREWTAAVGRARGVAVDGAALFSRPGPRLVDGVELLAWVIHRVGEQPPPGRAAEYVSGHWTDIGLTDVHRTTADPDVAR